MPKDGGSAGSKRKSGGSSVSFDDDTGLSEDKLRRKKQDTECKRLRQLAYARGMFSERPCADDELEQSIKIPKALRACHGGAIVKKASRKRSKHLFAFPGIFVPGASGMVGTLKQLDTLTPALYMDFEPHGRLKLCGATVYPRTNLLSLQCRSNPKTDENELVCEDVFDRVVVFSDYVWVGREEDNPDDKPITPIPYDVAKMINKRPGGAADATPSSVSRAKKVKAAAGASTGGKAEDDGEHEADDKHGAEAPGSARRGSRRSTAKPVNYNMDVKLTADSSSSEEEDDILAPKLKHSSTSSSSRGGKAKSATAASSEAVDLAGDESGADADAPAPGSPDREGSSSATKATAFSWSPTVKDSSGDGVASTSATKRRGTPVTLAAGSRRGAGSASQGVKRSLGGGSGKGKVRANDEGDGDDGDHDSGRDSDGSGGASGGGRAKKRPQIAHLSSSSDDDDWDALLTKARQKASTMVSPSVANKHPVVELSSGDEF